MRKRRRIIPNIKPHLLPVDDIVTQLVRNVLWFFALTELQACTPDYIYLGITRLGFQVEEILK